MTTPTARRHKIRRYKILLVWNDGSALVEWHSSRIKAKWRYYGYMKEPAADKMYLIDTKTHDFLRIML